MCSCVVCLCVGCDVLLMVYGVSLFVSVFVFACVECVLCVDCGLMCDVVYLVWLCLFVCLFCYCLMWLCVLIVIQCVVSSGLFVWCVCV